MDLWPDITGQRLKAANYYYMQFITIKIHVNTVNFFER